MIKCLMDVSVPEDRSEMFLSILMKITIIW